MDAIGTVKVSPREGRYLRVGWMVDGLDADDALLELGVVRVHVVEEVEFRRRRADDDDFVGSIERLTVRTPTARGWLLRKSASCVIAVIAVCDASA